MALPWVRLDSNVGSHDKILALEADPSPKKWQAMASYFIALGWSGGHGTDGKIPPYALSSVKGTAVTARLLVKYRLWAEATAGWEIVNWGHRQLMVEKAADLQAKRKYGSTKGNCVRWHEPNCWQNGACSRDPK